jgi:hypothetical protein
LVPFAAEIEGGPAGTEGAGVADWIVADAEEAFGGDAGGANDEAAAEVKLNPAKGLGGAAGVPLEVDVEDVPKLNGFGAATSGV